MEQEFDPRHKKNKEEEETEKDKNRKKTYIIKCKILLPNIEVEWRALLVCIWEVPA